MTDDDIAKLYRRAMNSLATFLAAGAVFLVLLPLVAIFVYLVYKGFGSLNWAFLTQTPKPVGEPGTNITNSAAQSGTGWLKTGLDALNGAEKPLQAKSAAQA